MTRKNINIIGLITSIICLGLGTYIMYAKIELRDVNIGLKRWKEILTLAENKDNVIADYSKTKDLMTEIINIGQICMILSSFSAITFANYIRLGDKIDDKWWGNKKLIITIRLIPIITTILVIIGFTLRGDLLAVSTQDWMNMVWT